MSAWDTGWQQGAQTVEKNKEHKRNRQEQLQDEQRNQKLSVYTDLFHQDRISAAEMAHAVEDVHHDAEPERKMQLLGRIFNQKKARQQHQYFLQGRQKSATEQQGIIAGAKTSQQVTAEAADQKRGQMAPDEIAGIDAFKKSLKAVGFTDDQVNDAVKVKYGLKAKAGGPPKEYVSQDGKQRGWFTVGEQPEGWQAQTGAEKPAKPPTPSAQYANLTAKKILADKKQGPPLTNEESAQLEGAKGALTVAGIARANAFAQAAAANNLTVVTGDDGEDVLATRKQAVDAANSGKPMTAGVVGAPTGEDKQTQMFANSSLNRLKEMRSIVQKHPEIFGPAGGRKMKVSVWLGTQSPEAQKFRQDAQFLAEHSTAVFGGRAASTVEELKKIESDPTANPDALLAGFDSDEATLNDFTRAGGRLPAPKKQAAPAPKAGAKEKKNAAGDTVVQGPDGKWKLKDAASAN